MNNGDTVVVNLDLSGEPLQGFHSTMTAGRIELGAGTQGFVLLNCLTFRLWNWERSLELLEVSSVLSSVMERDNIVWESVVFGCTAGALGILSLFVTVMERTVFHKLRCTLDRFQKIL